MDDLIHNSKLHSNSKQCSSKLVNSYQSPDKQVILALAHGELANHKIPAH